MKWRQFVYDYLKFGKRDRIGLLVVLTIISATYLIPLLFAKHDKVLINPDPGLLSTIDTLNEKQTQQENDDDDRISYDPQPSLPTSFSKGSLFLFDPNVLPEEGWKKLGLKNKTITTIINYRSKGGRFYKPEDLKKIWGLPKGFYDHVSAYISINRQEQKT